MAEAKTGRARADAQTTRGRCLSRRRTASVAAAPAELQRRRLVGFGSRLIGGPSIEERNLVCGMRKRTFSFKDL